MELGSGRRERKQGGEREAGSAGVLQQQGRVGPHRDAPAEYAPVTVQFQGQTQPVDLPPEGRVPGKRDYEEKGALEEQRIARPRMLRAD